MNAKLPKGFLQVAQMKNKQTKAFAKKMIIALFFLILLLLFIVIYILPNVSDAFEKTDIAEFGVIQVKQEVTCYLIRDEVVYNAKSDGTVEYFVEEGNQIRKGTKILELLPSGTSYFSDQRGMISFYIDGFETILSKVNMQNIKKKAIDELEFTEIKPVGKVVERGQPLYKIVNSDNWHIIFWIDKESILKYEKDKPIQLKLPSSYIIKGTIADIKADGNNFIVIAEFNRYFELMPQIRKMVTEVITADYKGLAIRNESITSENGQTGVFVKDLRGEFVFTPVKVITSDGVYSLVECSFYYDNTAKGIERISTVDIYDEVLRDAS
jgi:putative membrane fusion protein